MALNIGRCRVMNLGTENQYNKYTLRNVPLKESGTDLRPQKQCVVARNRANRVLEFIYRSVKSRSERVILKLYVALVRPHLDYAARF